MKTDIRRRNILRGIAIASATTGGILGVRAASISTTPTASDRTEQLNYHLRQIKDVMNDLVGSDGRWFVSVAGKHGAGCSARATHFEHVPIEGFPGAMTERPIQLTDVDL